MKRKLLYYFLTILIGIVNFVVAPPPLDVELRAEKLQENSQDLQKSEIGNVELVNKDTELNEQIKKKFDLLKLDLKDERPGFVNIIEDPKELKVLLAKKNVDNREVVEEFTRLELPTDFNEYDVNGDGFIDLEELIDATGARENAKSAFDDSDVDGDGKISKKEFSYWFPDGITLDISDELNNYDHTENDDESLTVDNDDDSDDVDDDEITVGEYGEESDDDIDDDDDNDKNKEVDDEDDIEESNDFNGDEDNENDIDNIDEIDDLDDLDDDDDDDKIDEVK